MRRKISLLLSVIVWFSVVAQFYLMVQNRTASMPETVVRFFSFFTILTNTLAALYFTIQAFGANRFKNPGTLTAITVYITMVGFVYQVLLRHIWEPTGLQMVVDELLHTVNPVLVIIYWYFFEKKEFVMYKQIIEWSVYPILYLVYILIRGNYSGFYPYPFINVNIIGSMKALSNALLLLLFFSIISLLFIFVGRLVSKKIKQAMLNK